MSASPKKNDVFISFRGEDGRTRFTGHLRAALEREGIKVYIDDYLRRGEEIWPSLSQAIEDSHVAVVVFSENYANSSWCLEELVKILECRKRDGQVVIPVFYEVDPSHIRKQRGTYREGHTRKHLQYMNNDFWMIKTRKGKLLNGRLLSLKRRIYRDGILETTFREYLKRMIQRETM